MTRFYTKKGDDGYTSLLGERRVPKHGRQIDALGTIDEANAALGLARATAQDPQTKSILIVVQRDLYHLMAEIAATPENAVKFREINIERVNWLEGHIEAITRQVPVPNEFIVPGDSLAGATLDLVRTIVRRAERHVAKLLHQKKIKNQHLLAYLNRLSSLCFALELLENQAAGSVKPTLAREES
jgi:cob(I)alamin adenosyltransferase